MDTVVLIRFMAAAILCGLSSARASDGLEPAAPANEESVDRAGGLQVSATGFNIYLLEDENIDLETARAMPLSALVLRKKPWIALEDIERYDLSSHYIYLKKSVSRPLKTVSMRGNPFVVTVGGQRCYLGSLWSLWSSFLPEQSTPLIYVPDVITPPDIVVIRPLLVSAGADEQARDVRNELRVIQALVQSGRCHAGLSLSLDRVEVRPREGGASVRYTYTLRNKDTDHLYVFDPARMGIDLFHYFNNPLSLRARQGDSAVGPERSRMANQPPAEVGFDMKWFSRLRSGESMTRTVILEGYPQIASGEYECLFRFHSPGAIATKDKRVRTDGRVWMGEIEAKLMVDVAQSRRDNRERSRKND